MLLSFLEPQKLVVTDYKVYLNANGRMRIVAGIVCLSGASKNKKAPERDIVLNHGSRAV